MVVSCNGCNQSNNTAIISDKTESKTIIQSDVTQTAESRGSQHIAVFSKCTNYDNSLSAIASEVRFIPLDNEPPINDFHTTDVALTDDYLFLLSLSHQGIIIYQYDLQGRFIRNIGSRGMGPTEYVNISPPLQIDYQDETIYALDINRRRVVGYNFNGTFIRAFQANYQGQMAILDINSIAFRPSTIGEAMFLPNAPFLSFTDRNGKNEKVYHSHLHPVISRNEAKNFPNSNPLWEYAGKFYYLEYGADTIFRISKDEFFPAWTLTGELKPDKKDLFLEDKGRKLSIISLILRPNSGIFESHNSLIFRLIDNQETFFMVYNKITGQFHRTYERDAPIWEGRKSSRINRDYFIDDIVSGLHFNPQYQSMNKAIALIPATKVVEKRDEILRHLNIHPSVESERLKPIVKKTNEFDNPVVMIVTFK